jgi:hypothetical protein
MPRVRLSSFYHKKLIQIMSKADRSFTPFRYVPTGNERFRQQTQHMLTLPEIRRRHATEMQGKWIGPFDPAIFMKDLMPINDEELAAIPKNAKFHHPCHRKNKVREKHFCELFVSGLM